MNKKLLVATLLIVCVTLSIFAAMQLSTYGQPPINCTVFVDPPDQNMLVCTHFPVNVNIKGVETPPIHDYDFFLSYDSTKMTPEDAWDGGFLMPPLMFFQWEIVDNPGDIDQVHCWAKTADGGAIGQGTLATIQFHCIAAGNSALTLQVLLSDQFENQYVPTAVINGVVHQWITMPHTYIDPPDYTVPICIPFPVNVKINDVTDLYSFSLQLSYNTLYADCLDIVDGGFLTSPTTVTMKSIDEAGGTIRFDLTSTGGAGASGSGSLAKITFHCTGAGESILNIDSISLFNSAGMPIPTTSAGGRVIQVQYWEPTQLIDIVEWPYPYALADSLFVPPDAPAFLAVKTELQNKGFVFDPSYGGTTMNATLFIEEEEVHVDVTSWWSSNTLEDGTRACVVYGKGGRFGVAEPTFMVMGFVTNLLPPEQVPDVDPYIIVNAMPYMYLRFYWWAWPTDVAPGHIVTWPYWWYDSHSHPNWFWGPYWWWRTYTKAYYYPYVDVPYWQPWWGWWWHWVYCRHWYWWSSYFPYGP